MFARVLSVCAVLALTAAVSPRAINPFRFARARTTPCEVAQGVCQDVSKPCYTEGKMKEYVSGMCPGTPANVRCCKEVSPKVLCLTFDDGPFPSVTPDLLTMLKREGVPSVFYLNCHDDDVATSIALAKRMAAEGHVLANHMCWHDVMGANQYKDSYYPSRAAKFKDDTCLQTPDQVSKFKRYFNGVIDQYSKIAEAERGKLFMKFLRLNGDGRFFSCLKQKAAGYYPGTLHMGWNYEITSPGTFPAREGSEFKPTGTPGVLGSGDLSSGDVVLAHDLHWTKGRLDNLAQWIQARKKDGFAFVLPNANGGCGDRPLHDAF